MVNSMRKLWLRRKAVATIVGGIIIMTLFLTAIVAMIIVSQQYDNYQTTANAMSQNDIARYSEHLMPIDPGLTYSPQNPVNGCGNKCNLYNLLLSNNGGVGVQVARIYINSTNLISGGCIGLCVLDPGTATTPAAYSFGSSDAFLNAGEFNHTIRLWVPNAITLPLNPGSNTIWLVTARGRIFTFLWPFVPNPLAKPGTIPDLITGIMKVAYNGTWSSSNEGKSLAGYCHEKPEQLPGPNNSTLVSFVNPWITNTILTDALNKPNSPTTTLWVYALLNNTTGKTISVNNGNIILQTADAAADGKPYFISFRYVSTVPLVTIGQNRTYTSATVQMNQLFVVIFRADAWSQSLQTKPGMNAAAANGDIFLGTGSVNNAKGTLAEGNDYNSVFFFLEGVYLKVTC